MQAEVIKALGLTSYINCLRCIPILQNHRFIQKDNRAVKVTSQLVDGDNIKRTFRGVKDKSKK